VYLFIGDRVLARNEILLIRCYLASETRELYIRERMESALNRFRFTPSDQNKSVTTLN